MSRREFLKAGIVSAMGFLIEIGIPKEVRAQLEKVLAQKEFISSNFEEGIRLLEADVWEKNDEQMLLYMEKWAKKGWIDVSGHSSEDDVLSIDLAPIFDDYSLTELCIAHTHPAVLYKNKKFDYINKDLAENILKNKKSTMPIPPGSADIMSAIIAKNLLKEKNNTQTKLSHLLVEPSGIWKYSADIDHHGSSRLYALYEEGNIQGSLQLYDELRDWRIKFSQNLDNLSEYINEFQRWIHEKYGITLSYEAKT